MCFYYFDDLGLLGGLLHFGLLGIILHIVPLARMLFIAFKLLKQKRTESVWALGAITYIVVSQISLNYLDYHRTVVVPLYWALFEILYANVDYSFQPVTENDRNILSHLST